MNEIPSDCFVTFVQTTTLMAVVYIKCICHGRLCARDMNLPRHFDKGYKDTLTNN